jgi:hypothetical protein
MKILILEDDPERMKIIKPLIEGNDYHWITSAFDEIEPHYDLYMLDHDLGGRQMDEHEDCGMVFVEKHLEQLQKSFVIIHSFNVPAAIKMHEKITSCGTNECVYTPFGGITWRHNVKAVINHYAKNN